MTASQTLSAAEAETLSVAALGACGASSESARALAAGIVAAELGGIASHGLAYLPTYCEHLRCGKVVGDARPALSESSPVAFVVDAGCGFAHPAIALGFASLIPAARAQGLAALAVRNSYNCGVLGFHTERLARAGLLGLGFTNAPASIAPAGGRRAVIGTNPFSLAVPDGDGGVAFLVDQSASVVAKSEIMARSRRGESLPEGWALDADGRPTTEAAAALKGTMLPSGGYKGFGAGLLVEVMAAALSGASLGIDASPFSGTAGGPPRTGQFFLALSPAHFSGGAFAARIESLARAIAEQPGARLPGAHRLAARERIRAEDIAVPASLLEKIRGYAGAAA